MFQSYKHLAKLADCTLKALLILSFFSVDTLAQLPQWEILKSGTDAHFRSIATFRKNHVWAGGSKGTVLHSANAGKTWETIQVPEAGNLDFRDIQVLDKKNILLMSAGEAEKGQAKIFKSSDTGKTWKEVFSTNELGVFLDGMDFWNSQEGIIWGDPINNQAFALKTQDAGNTWQQISPEKLPAMLPKEASFAASGTGLVTDKHKKVWIATQSRIFYSDDKATTWSAFTTPILAGESSGIFGLYVGSKQIFAVGGDYKNDKAKYTNVIKSQDGGHNWETLSIAQPQGLKEAMVQHKKCLLLVGTSGTSYSEDEGAIWINLDNLAFHTLTSNGKYAFAIGGKGQLARLRWKK